MVQHDHAPSAPASGERAHQTGGAGAQDYDIGGMHDACGRATLIQPVKRTRTIQKISKPSDWT
jgi:hypothetical protein